MKAPQNQFYHSPKFNPYKNGKPQTKLKRINKRVQEERNMSIHKVSKKRLIILQLLTKC